jgi:hypothetical protein
VALVAVLVNEHGEQDAVDRGFGRKVPIGRVRRRPARKRRSIGWVVGTALPAARVG